MNSEHTNTIRRSPRKTKRLVISGLFAALLCISAYLSIPIPLPMAPKITLINFVLLLIALLFPVRQSFWTVIVWFLLGVIGLPVFIGGGAGVGYLLAPYGAYTWAFPLVALILPLIRGKSYHRIWYTVCAIIGVVLIDVIGMFYLMYVSHYNLATGFTMGFIPFIPLDLVKAVVAAQLIPAFQKVTE